VTAPPEIRSFVSFRSPPWLPPLAVGVAGAAISSIGMSVPSFWTDEVATVTSARRSLGELWAMLGNVDAVHGFYYMFMHFYLRVVPANEFTMRLPSLVAMGVAAAGVVVVGRMLQGPATGVAAGIVFIVLPRVTWMAIEARSSAFVTASVIWVTVAFLMALRTNKRGWWSLYVVGVILSIYLVVFVALLLVAHGISLVWRYRLVFRAHLDLLTSWLVSAVIAAVVALPFVRVVAGQSGQITADRPSAISAAAGVFINQYFLGALPSESQSLGRSVHTTWAIPAMLLALTSLLVAGYGIARGDRKPDSTVGVSLIQLTIPWIVIPTCLVLVYSEISHPIYNPRYLAFTAPAAALLIGNGLVALRRRWVQGLTLLLVVCLAAPVFVSQRGPTAKKGSDWAITAANLNANATPGDVVIYGGIYGKNGASTRKLAIGYPLPTIAALRDITFGKTGAQRDLVWGTSIPLASAMKSVTDAPRVWVVLDSKVPQGGSSDVTTQLLAGHDYHLTRSWVGPITSLYEFESPTPNAP
jgi:mannosyltransferase